MNINKAGICAAFAAVLMFFAAFDCAQAKRHPREMNPNGRMVTRRKAEAQWAKEYQRQENRRAELYGEDEYDESASPINNNSIFKRNSEYKRNSKNNSTVISNPSGGSLLHQNSANMKSASSEQSSYAPVRPRRSVSNNLDERVSDVRSQIKRANVSSENMSRINQIERDLNSSDRMVQQRAVSDWNNLRKRRDIFND